MALLVVTGVTLVGTVVSTVVGTVAVPGAPAAAFGTSTPRGNQHQLITRAALACAPGVPSDGSCFEAQTLDQLAGTTGTAGGTGGNPGAVGQPDADETDVPAAHCDDADFLATPGYPQTRAAATAALERCVVHLRGRFVAGVAAGDLVLRPDGTLSGEQVDLRSPCTFFDPDAVDPRAKCQVLEGLGRALHGIQDFYSHSNWTDVAAPGPVSLENPPGLGLSAPSPLMDMRGSGLPPVPADFTTGFFQESELNPLTTCADQARASRRVTHLCLNKDTEQITLPGGTVTPCASSPVPCTTRGRVGNNAANAVAGAIVETRRAWADMRAAIVAAYGVERGRGIISAVTQDVPRLDLVFTIDTTGSMFDDIAAVKESAASLVDQVFSDLDVVDSRVAVVEYRDLHASCPQDGFASRVVLGFTAASDRARILAAIQGLTLGDGCDTPESVHSGVMTALDLPWRDGAVKAVLLTGDAPAHDPEPVTGFTQESVLARARAIDPAVLFTVELNEGAGDTFEQLAALSGGTHVDAAGAAAVPAALRTSLAQITATPTADPGGPYSAGVGEPILLDASGSTTPEGTITEYAWDFTSDGTFDAVGTGPTASHAYPTAGTASVTLRVTDSRGRTHVAFAGVVVGLNAAPVADAGGSYSVPLGAEVLFDASGSSDPDGTITEYAWDFESDGVVDITLPGPTVTWVYPGPFAGTVTLRVTDDLGRVATDTAEVVVGPFATGDLHALGRTLDELTDAGEIVRSLERTLRGHVLAAQAAFAAGDVDAVRAELEAIRAAVDRAAPSKRTPVAHAALDDALLVLLGPAAGIAAVRHEVAAGWDSGGVAGSLARALHLRLDAAQTASSATEARDRLTSARSLVQRATSSMVDAPVRQRLLTMLDELIAGG